MSYCICWIIDVSLLLKGRWCYLWQTTDSLQLHLLILCRSPRPTARPAGGWKGAQTCMSAHSPKYMHMREHAQKHAFGIPRVRMSVNRLTGNPGALMFLESVSCNRLNFRVFATRYSLPHMGTCIFQGICNFTLHCDCHRWINWKD